MNFTKGTTVQACYNYFIVDKQTMGCANATIDDYNSSYKYFTRFFDVSKTPDNIHPKIHYDYLLYLKKNKPNLSPKSVDTYLRHFRAILHFWMDEGFIPFFRIKLPTYEETIKDPYTKEELKKLIGQKPKLNPDTEILYRNWFIGVFLFATAIRLSSLSEMKIKDIDFDNNMIAIKRSKNKKPYYIPMSPKLKKVLYEYLTYRKCEENDFLILSKNGSKMSLSGLQSAIERYNESKGVLKTSAHLYRHTFAKHYLLNGGKMEILQILLGHSSIEMSRKYCKIYNIDLQINYDKLNPYDNFVYS